MKTQQAEALELRIERVIRADRKRVFAAWTEPEQLKRWSAPEGLTMSEGEGEVRAGGRWRAVMVEPNGTRHEAFGTYREVTPPERLVFTHAWRLAGDGGPASSPETVVTVEFKAEAGATRIVFTQVGFANAPIRDGHRAGWTSALDLLAAMLGENA